jgi:hypothetical protein
VFLAGIEEVIYKVSFHTNIPGKKIRKKSFRKLRFSTKEVDHRLLFDADNHALLVDSGCRHAAPLFRQTALAEEAVLWQNGNHRFFATLRYHSELYPAVLDVEHRIRRVPLRIDRFIGVVLLTSFFSGKFR